MSTTLTAVVIALNEEAHLPACLASLDWVDELVVVDAGSTDRTQEIARHAGARLFMNPWPGYGPQKNFAFEQARGEWVLIVDADERVSPALRDEIRELLQGARPPACDAYDVPRRNYWLGHWLRWGGAYPDRQIRLVRRGRVRYNTRPLHEGLLIDGPVEALRGDLIHEAFRGLDERLPKVNRYTDLAAGETLTKRHVVRWYDFVARPLAVFLKLYVVKQGFRDGVLGFIYAGLNSFAAFAKYTKMWEQLRER
jgi:glycosyltransferase involved in cell wall biosynthesis